MGRAPFVMETPTVFLARDEFAQTVSGGSDPLAGLTLPVGGTWGGAGDTDDFVVEDTGHTCQRTAASDADQYTGRYAIPSASGVAGQVVQVDFKTDTIADATGRAHYMGLLARYTDANNRITVIYNPIGDNGGTAAALRVVKRLSGTPTVVASLPLTIAASTYYTIRFLVNAVGQWWLWFNIASQSTPTLVANGYDADFRTGTLSSGKPGIYDARTGSGSPIRTYDNFSASAITANAVIFANQSARFLHDTALRENAAGTSEGRVPVFQGKHLTIEPATRADFQSRLVVKARKYDSDSGLPDQGLTSNLTGTLVVTPRIILLSNPSGS